MKTSSWKRKALTLQKKDNFFVDLTHLSENKLIVQIMELCDTGFYTLDMAFRLS